MNPAQNRWDNWPNNIPGKAEGDFAFKGLLSHLRKHLVIDANNTLGIGQKLPASWG